MEINTSCGKKFNEIELFIYILTINYDLNYPDIWVGFIFTFNLANCGPLNAVLGRFSSTGVPFSLGGFFGRLARGPSN